MRERARVSFDLKEARHEGGNEILRATSSLVYRLARRLIKRPLNHSLRIAFRRFNLLSNRI